MPWSRPLASQITLRDKRVLRTLDDAAQLLLRFNDAIQAHPWVQHAAALLIAAAESGDADAIEEATLQTQRALSREGLL